MLPDNWDIVRVFVACSTQWRHGPSGHLTGLDYAGCRAAVAGIGLRWRDVFDGLLQMEVATLNELSIGDASRRARVALERR